MSKYDATDDFARSIEEAYREIRERMAKGGPSWTQKEYKPLIQGTRDQQHTRWFWLAVLVLVVFVFWLFFDVIEQAWQ